MTATDSILHDHDISWVLSRLDTPDRVDLLELNEFELYDHACVLQRENRAQRAVIKAAIAQLHEKDRGLEQQRRETGRLRSELRALRERTMGRNAA
jgi:hypothetical protein